MTSSLAFAAALLELMPRASRADSVGILGGMGGGEESGGDKVTFSAASWIFHSHLYSSTMSFLFGGGARECDGFWCGVAGRS